MEFNRIGVVGAGTMGNGISQALAASGFEVVMTDVAQAQIDRGLAAISGGCDRLVKREKMTAADKAAALGRIRTSTELSALRDCDLLIEAATENLELKLKLFRQLDELLPEHAVLASNTSSISITRLAAVTKRADRVVGMHFFNPVAMMALVELIRGLQTSDPSYAAVEALARRIGKSPVSVRNSPGFVVNRVLCPMINEAIFALGEGLASAREIDEEMKLGANHPMGPLALADLIGLDVELAVMQVLYEGFKDPKYRPAPLLVEMVEAGYLGRKSGRGFHRYDQ
ncbi:MAG: 3-hydroxybutyryl-CoA dehydrogenase [Betaproteobacteria bacterium RIFCSPLOWO2_02_FULL_66_14]|nr:MAG: 3-hydroxybutyryl-CoA dehydrogenase [Betaproteobacteria bacterium RIFCSPLOWO2_02_FULL_66_14]